MPSVDYFIIGELISLRLPVLPEDVEVGGWYKWFNDFSTTRFLEHGISPISPEEEVGLLTNEMRKSNALILAIEQNKTQKLVGTIALKNIHHIQQRAEISIVMGGNIEPGASLEAMALMTRHAFDRLNLKMLYAGQHEKLWKWVNSLRTIGFKIDGYRPCYGVRDGSSYGILLTSITSEEFYSLQKKRGGDVLSSGVFETMKSRPRQCPIETLRKNRDCYGVT